MFLPQWLYQRTDGTWRPSSIAFIDRLSGEVSVHRAALTTVAQVLAQHPADSLAEIQARLPRALGYAVVADPTPADPSHALICPQEGGFIKKADARRMAEQARWVVCRRPGSS